MLPVEGPLARQMEVVQRSFTAWRHNLMSIFNDAGLRDEALSLGGQRDGLPAFRLKGVLATVTGEGEVGENQLPRYRRDYGYLLVFAGRVEDAEKVVGVWYPTESILPATLGKVEMSRAYNLRREEVFRMKLAGGDGFEVSIPCGELGAIEVFWDDIGGDGSGVSARRLWFPASCFAPDMKSEALFLSLAGENKIIPMNTVIGEAYRKANSSSREPRRIFKGR